MELASLRATREAVRAAADAVVRLAHYGLREATRAYQATAPSTRPTRRRRGRVDALTRRRRDTRSIETRSDCRSALSFITIRRQQRGSAQAADAASYHDHIGRPVSRSRSANR